MARLPIAQAEVAPQQPKRASTGRLEQAQTDRQRRVIAAALQLAAERGTPDAIQMRDIAERSKVALGTIYKYYRSKDQIMAAAFLEWANRNELDAVPFASSQDSLVERAVEVIRRTTRSIEREPNLSRALFLSVHSSNRVHGLDQDLSQVLTRLLKSALASLDEASFQGVQKILIHVWNSSFISWMNGWCDLNEVGDELEFACRWLLAGLHPPPQGEVSAEPSS